MTCSQNQAPIVNHDGLKALKGTEMHWNVCLSHASHATVLRATLATSSLAKTRVELRMTEYKVLFRHV